MAKVVVHRDMWARLTLIQHRVTKDGKRITRTVFFPQVSEGNTSCYDHVREYVRRHMGNRGIQIKYTDANTVLGYAKRQRHK